MVHFRIKLHFWSFWMCLFAAFFRQITDANMLNTILTEHAELLKTVRSYEIVKLYRLEGRRKRHASTRLLNQDSHVEETTLVLDGVKHRFTLDITLNKGLFSPDYRETHILRDGTRTVGQKRDNCFYHGTVQEDSNATVSLSTCDGIEGIIRTNKGSFFIHPLKSKEGNVLEEHLVFSSNDVNDELVTCGHNHKISLKNEFDHQKEIPNSKRRVRRNIKNEIKYLELFLINDNAQFRKFKGNTELRAKQLANHLDSIYRFQNIRIALVLVETWEDRDLIVVDANATKALANFIKYKKKTLDKDKGKHWDNVQLITGIDFDGSTVGYAPIRSICGSRSAAVVQDYSKTAAVTASTMAHELGHNLGMRHDTPTCECPANGECVMSAFLSAAVTRFSTCSLNQLSETLEEGYGTCLFDKPNKLFGPAICGNGYVEESEQCDCGTQEECDHFENKCCNATTCMLYPEAVCGHGECCDNCQFRSRGHLCRKKHDDCDLREYCTGDNEVCPEDTYIHDGIPCKDDSGYCYGGVCRALTLQCQYLFGETVTAGKDVCFNRNVRGGFFDCYNDTHGNHPCAERDVKCGKLHCLSDKKRFPIKGQDRHYSSVFSEGKFCLVPGVTVGDGQDLEYAQDGTKCGTDMMCKDSKCIPVTVAVPISAYDKCKDNCSGNGICNHKGSCHCNSGYACPDCSNTGHDRGGSSDSGQGCETISKKGGINLAAAILIPLFIVILIIVVVVVYRHRTAIQDRLNRYKLVRRSVARSSSAAGSRRTGTERPTIIGPTTIEFKPSDTESNQPLVVRREPPPRPSAPSAPMGNEKQPSWGTPAQPSWGTPAQQPAQQPAWGTPAKQPSPVRKPPPAVPTHLRGQPRTGHQSVPLFPPSAVPEPQESMKPRRPPSGPPTGPDYENLPPAAPPKPLPGKPKLPPSHNTPNHSSLPDLVSPAKPKTPTVTPRANAGPRPKPRVPLGSHWSVPEFPDELPVPKPRNVGPRPGHQSVPLFNLPDAEDAEDVQSVRPSAVKVNQAKPSPPRKPRTTDNKPVDFRAGLKPVPKP